MWVNSLTHSERGLSQRRFFSQLSLSHRVSLRWPAPNLSSPPSRNPLLLSPQHFWWLSLVYHAAEHFLAAELHTESEVSNQQSRQRKASVNKHKMLLQLLDILREQTKMKRNFIFLVNILLWRRFLPTVAMESFLWRKQKCNNKAQYNFYKGQQNKLSVVIALKNSLKVLTAKLRYILALAENRRASLGFRATCEHRVYVSTSARERKQSADTSQRIPFALFTALECRRCCRERQTLFAETLKV